jgi:L-iditol 2-dehydrogenase
MKRIVLESSGEFRIEEADRPRPPSGYALVKIKKVGICGSDIHLYQKGYIGNITIEAPFVIGHECLGEVADVGEGVSPDLAGCRVAVEPAIPCNRCRWCITGRQNICPDVSFLGLPPKQGALQEYIIHPVDLLEKIPDGIEDVGASVLEPMAIALHAINLAKVRPGQNVVILGTGVIGTCVLSLLSLWKGLRIIGVDPIPERLERAREIGADVIIRPEGQTDVNGEVVAAAEGIGADVVFECAGVKETLWNMCEVAAPGAHLAVIGSNPDDEVLFSSGSARRKGLTLRFVRRSLNTLSQCIRLTEQGLISPQDLVTHIFSAAQVDQAFKTVNDYADGVLKALIDMEQWS